MYFLFAFLYLFSQIFNSVRLLVAIFKHFVARKQIDVINI